MCHDGSSMEKDETTMVELGNTQQTHTLFLSFSLPTMVVTFIYKTTSSIFSSLFRGKGKLASNIATVHHSVEPRVLGLRIVLSTVLQLYKCSSQFGQTMVPSKRNMYDILLRWRPHRCRTESLTRSTYVEYSVVYNACFTNT